MNFFDSVGFVPFHLHALILWVKKVANLTENFRKIELELIADQMRELGLINTKAERVGPPNSFWLFIIQIRDCLFEAFDPN